MESERENTLCNGMGEMMTDDPGIRARASESLYRFYCSLSVYAVMLVFLNQQKLGFFFYSKAAGHF